MLDTFAMAKGGKEYRRLVAAFERIFRAKIFGAEFMTATARVVHRSRFNFPREAQVWYDRDSDERVLGERFENVIVLSDEFYSEIAAHPIPADLEAVRLLAQAPGVLDLFMFLSYRCFTAKGFERIPLFGGAWACSPTGHGRAFRPRWFRAMGEDWRRVIRRISPDCPVQISPEGKHLCVRPGTAVKAVAVPGQLSNGL